MYDWYNINNIIYECTYIYIYIRINIIGEGKIKFPIDIILVTYLRVFCLLCHRLYSSCENSLVRRFDRKTMENVHKTTMHDCRTTNSQETMAEKFQSHSIVGRQRGNNRKWRNDYHFSSTLQQRQLHVPRGKRTRSRLNNLSDNRSRYSTSILYNKYYILFGWQCMVAYLRMVERYTSKLT